MKTLPGRKALITGGASGIGRALTLALADAGVDCYLLDVDEPGMASTVADARRRGVLAEGARCDLSQPAEISGSVKRLLATWGSIHILVNNAGVACYGAMHELTEDHWNRVMQVNLLAPIQLTRELLPVLLAQDEAHIVNVGSLASHVAARKLGPYNVSKFGILGLSETLRAEYGRGSLGVTALCPGFVDTRIYERMVCAGKQKRKPPRMLMTTPQRVARRAVRAIRRNDPVVVMAPGARLLWYLKRLAPGLFLRAFTWGRSGESAARPASTQRGDDGALHERQAA
jgi:NAD(P)-dependent dehydrogenase (short-subunit alcohol dehydrogenase family)